MSTAPEEQSGAVLELLNGPDRGRRIPVPTTRSVIGAGDEAQVRILGLEVEPAHAVLYRDAGRVFIEDFRSRSGILVNAKRALHRALADGDRVRLGRAMLRFHEHAEPTPASLSVASTEPAPDAMSDVMAALNPLGRTVRLFPETVPYRPEPYVTPPFTPGLPELDPEADSQVAPTESERIESVPLPRSPEGDLGGTDRARSEAPALGAQEASASAASPGAEEVDPGPTAGPEPSLDHDGSTDDDAGLRDGATVLVQESTDDAASRAAGAVDAGDAEVSGDDTTRLEPIRDPSSAAPPRPPKRQTPHLVVLDLRDRARPLAVAIDAAGRPLDWQELPGPGFRPLRDALAAARLARPLRIRLLLGGDEVRAACTLETAPASEPGVRALLAGFGHELSPAALAWQTQPLQDGGALVAAVSESGLGLAAGALLEETAVPIEAGLDVAVLARWLRPGRAVLEAAPDGVLLLARGARGGVPLVWRVGGPDPGRVEEITRILLLAGVKGDRTRCVGAGRRELRDALRAEGFAAQIGPLPQGPRGDRLLAAYEVAFLGARQPAGGALESERLRRREMTRRQLRLGVVVAASLLLIGLLSSLHGHRAWRRAQRPAGELAAEVAAGRPGPDLAKAVAEVGASLASRKADQRARTLPWPRLGGLLFRLASAADEEVAFESFSVRDRTLELRVSCPTGWSDRALRGLKAAVTLDPALTDPGWSRLPGGSPSSLARFVLRASVLDVPAEALR